MPGPVAESDARTPGIQTVEREFDPPVRKHSFMEIGHFYDHSLPHADSSIAVASYWRKDVH